MNLQGKHIILGVTGGIAAYKSALLARLLVKSGVEVQPIMTPSAKEFITPLTLSTLTGKPVISEFFTRNTGEWHSHVDLGLWADAMVIAPATACTLGKMAHGIADNMLVTTYLSARCPVFVAPAMDLDMMAHPSTVANLDLLSSRGVTVIEAASGELASHLHGKGRMAEPKDIVKVLEKSGEWRVESGMDSSVNTLQAAKLTSPLSTLHSPLSLKGKRVLVTAGPTHEKIDPVRFIGNYSSGKQGYALAEALAERGAEVMLVSGPVSLKCNNPHVKVVGVESARQMLEACTEAWPTCDWCIMCAAVADYRPAECHNRKIKREHDSLDSICLVKNPDIAATLGKSKRRGQLLAGFALETNDALTHGADKLRRKGLDLIAINSLEDEGAGFMTDTNRVTLLTADGNTRPLPLASKIDVAHHIIDTMQNLDSAL